jgi:hypothetical protein
VASNGVNPQLNLGDEATLARWLAFQPEPREFGELLIDLEEDKAARGVVFGLLAEMELR